MPVGLNNMVLGSPRCLHVHGRPSHLYLSCRVGNDTCQLLFSFFSAPRTPPLHNLDFRRPWALWLGFRASVYHCGFISSFVLTLCREEIMPYFCPLLILLFHFTYLLPLRFFPILSESTQVLPPSYLTHASDCIHLSVLKLSERRCCLIWSLTIDRCSSVFIFILTVHLDYQ